MKWCNIGSWLNSRRHEAHLFHNPRIQTNLGLQRELNLRHISAGLCFNANKGLPYFVAEAKQQRC
jgi:hypothetical protein